MLRLAVKNILSLTTIAQLTAATMDLAAMCGDLFVLNKPTGNPRLIRFISIEHECCIIFQKLYTDTKEGLGCQENEKPKNRF
jgi:hypothetical protein